MSEQMAFARKASGLVRGLSFWDAFGVGFMNQGLTPSMYVMISLGLGIYLGGNLLIATIISAVLCGIGFSLVWGILGGSMPRSGGEYIYNSRIIHPVVGIAESFGNAFVWIMWIFILAPWTADGVVMMAQYMGYPSIADAIETPTGIFLLATLTSVIALLFVVFGMKVFAKAQKVIMILAIAGCTIILLVFTFTSHAQFVQAWNNLAAQYNSLDYQSFLNAARAGIEESGKVLPTTWNWRDTFGVMVAGSWLFAYAYCITFIAGEVKRPDKTIILSNLAAVLVPAFFMAWLAIALYHSVGFEFLSATAWASNGQVETLAGYTFPWATNFVGLAATIVPTSFFLLFMMVLSWILFNLWWVALSYLAFPRILFAWGMDRMGPKMFADIDYRWASPVKNHILCFILGEIGIALYAFRGSPMEGLSVTGMEIVSVFGITAIAAAYFPFSKRARQIWDSSPYKSWNILGIPVVTIGAIVNLIYLAILFYFFIFMPEGEGLALKSVILYAIVWGCGIAWYFFWRYRNRRAGVDISMTYGELPPD
jgi:APA family basic amino acid/polyamine antiporter